MAMPLASSLIQLAAVACMLAAERALSCQRCRLSGTISLLQVLVILMATVAHATATAAEGKERDAPGAERQPDPLAAKPLHSRAPSAKRDVDSLCRRERITRDFIHEFGSFRVPVTRHKKISTQMGKTRPDEDSSCPQIRSWNN
jgi:hypothetical protein